MSSTNSSDGEATPWEKAESTFTSEYFDPCQNAANKSIKCLHRNGGDKELCADYFQAYKDCKKQWLNERREAKRRAGGGLFG